MNQKTDRKDAERYRWLRKYCANLVWTIKIDQVSNKSIMSDIRIATDSMSDPTETELRSFDECSMDVAVDKAIKSLDEARCDHGYGFPDCETCAGHLSSYYRPKKVSYR